MFRDYLIPILANKDGSHYNRLGCFQQERIALSRAELIVL